MTTFKDFSENGRLLSTREEILNPANMERYTTEHSLEKVEGYLDALNDMISAVDQIVYTRSNGNTALNSAVYIRNQIQELLKDRKQFLEDFQIHIGKPKSADPGPH